MTGLPASGTLNVRLMSYIWLGLAVQRLHLHDERRDQGGDVLADTRFNADHDLSDLQLDHRLRRVKLLAVCRQQRCGGSANILSQGGAQTSRTVTGLPLLGHAERPADVLYRLGLAVQ